MLPFLNFQKISIFFRTAKPTFDESLKLHMHAFRKTVKNREGKQRWKTLAIAS